MPKQTPVSLETPSISEERLRQLQELAPEAFSEGKIDFEKLRLLLGGAVDENPERYSFNWSGKRDAIRILSMPSRATLIPAKDESVNFDTTENIFIEGDNLEVLKLLYKPYFGAVKMIYIDPPYNTGNDFVYPDNYADPLDTYLRISGQKDEEGNLLTSNPESSGRYHSAWLSMMYPRLFMARQLLREDGVICVSIGEEELSNLTIILNEIFGEENFGNQIIVRRFDKNLNRQFIEEGLKTMNVGAEYVLIYAKSSEFQFNPVFRVSSEERQKFGYWKGFWNAPNRPTMRYEILEVTPTRGQWKWRKELSAEAVNNYQEYTLQFADKMTLEEYWVETGKSKRFIRRNPRGRSINQGVEHWIPPSNGILRSSNWTDILASESSEHEDLKFDSPKNSNFISELIRLCTDEDDIVLDFFAGSATTAISIFLVNESDISARKFILAQLPQLINNQSEATISQLAMERIRRYNTDKEKSIGMNNIDSGFKVYKLTESNFRQWQGSDSNDPDAYARTMALHSDTLFDTFVPENVIYEIALKEGFTLNCTIEKVDGLKKVTVYKVTDSEKGQSFFITLDEEFSLASLAPLNLDRETLFICRDTALTDETAANLALQCRIKTL